MKIAIEAEKNFMYGMEQKHCIKKQIIEIRTGNNRDVAALQEEISAAYHSTIIPYINACCDSLSRPGTTHKIERLELDIGAVNPDYLAVEFEEKLKPVLYAQLAQKIEAVPRVFSVEQPGTEPPERQKGTAMELLRYFIQTGLLPWWAEKQDKQALEKALEKRIVDAPGEVAFFVQAIMNTTAHLKRFIFHFSDETLLKTAELILPGSSFSLENYWQELQHLTGIGVFKNVSATTLRLECFKSLFFTVSDPEFTNSRKELLVEYHLVQLAEGLKINYSLMIRELSDYITQSKRDSRQFKSALPRVIATVHNRLTAKKVPGAVPEGRRGGTVAGSRTPHAKLYELEAQLEALHQQEHSKNVQEQREGLQQEIRQLKTAENLFETVNNSFNQSDEIYINNAGLVLLWPFLLRFFETIGLVKEKTFADEIDTGTSKNNPDSFRERAALLLQYVLDGSETTSEHLLPLNKILCGIDLLQPLEPTLILSEAEKEECEHLLMAVAAGNSMWKNLSAEGLQASYLQREGILSFRDGGWWLQVEKKTYDITMNKLPWSVTVIKLPWMDTILYTEW